MVRLPQRCAQGQFRVWTFHFNWRDRRPSSSETDLGMPGIAMARPAGGDGSPSSVVHTQIHRNARRHAVTTTLGTRHWYGKAGCGLHRVAESAPAGCTMQVFDHSHVVPCLVPQSRSFRVHLTP